MTQVTMTTLESGDVCFALELKHLHPDRGLDAEAVANDGTALVTALGGQSDARFVLQTACFPNLGQPERGRIAIHLLVALTPMGSGTAARADELCDVLLELFAAPPIRWSFEPVTDPDTLASALEPVAPVHVAELARREESLLLIEGESDGGFEAQPPTRTSEHRLWSMWTLGPASRDLRRLASVLLAQGAPVCIRVSLTPSALTEGERSAIEGLLVGAEGDEPRDGLLRASLRTLGSLRLLRPLLEVRCVVASSAPLSRSMLTVMGDTVSEPANPGAPESVLRGGFAVLRGGVDVGVDTLVDAYRTLSCGEPTPTIAPAGLERLRRMLGSWEAANIFRIPSTDEDGFPGLDTLRVPDFDVPLFDLATAGHVLGCLVGDTRRQVLIDPEERMRHLYVSGQSDTDKSTLLLNLVLQDIESGAGVAVIDPRGDLVDALLGRIPEDRLDDVVLIDPVDETSVAGVDLLEADTPAHWDNVTFDLVATFYALFDPNRQGIIGPHHETLLRQAALLLLANPGQPSSFLDIPTVLVDDAVRARLLQGVEDPAVAEFWFSEMAQAPDHHTSEAIAWIQSKFEIFRTSPFVRNVAGQTGSTVSLSNVMREQRILLVNVSRNRPEGMYQPAILGEYNSSLIGHIVVSRVRAAVLERASLPPNERKDFFVYIDEFQNMTSDSWGALLSDARKSRVGITLSNESFSQLRAVTQDALVRGVGSRVTFRVGAQDSKPLASWLGTGVFPEDLPWLPNDTAVAALSARRESIKPFPFRTQAPASKWTRERARAARNSSRIWWAASTPLLDPIFFHRWAHVEGSGDARRFAERAAQLSEHVDPQPTPEPGFIETWILNRILINTTRDPVDVHLPRGAIGIFPECVRFIQRRFGFDYDRSVRIASAGEGGSIQGMTRAHATALRYELRLLGADLEITPDRADATDGHAPVDPGTISIADLGLSERPKMCLTRAKVTSVTELTSRSLADLRNHPQLGKKSLEEIIEVLAQRGLELRADPSPGGLKPNQTWLASIGLGGLAEADQVSLLEVVQGEAEARVGRTVPEEVTDEEIREFLSTTGVDDYAAIAAVPNLGEVIAWTLNDLQSELSEAKEMILRELATNDPS